MIRFVGYDSNSYDILVKFEELPMLYVSSAFLVFGNA